MWGGGAAVRRLFDDKTENQLRCCLLHCAKLPGPGLRRVLVGTWPSAEVLAVRGMHHETRLALAIINHCPVRRGEAGSQQTCPGVLEEAHRYFRRGEWE